MSKYLYGAAVQGIQGFIFQTNKLQEIVGASELVEQICTSLFKETLDRKCNVHFQYENAVLNAAGNIKYIFDDENDCRSVVRVFPKTVMEFAPGITISQSVVKFEDGDFHNAVQQLENNLRTQRNKPMRDLNVGLMGIERSRLTGLPVTHVKGDAHMDSGTYHKLYGENRDAKGDRVVRKNTTQKLCEKSFGKFYSSGKLAFDIGNITGDNDWVAIIHADGNGLGQIVQKIGNNKEMFKRFSVNLDRATTVAAVQAFDKVVKEEAEAREDSIIHMRPIVLSGDDHTVICRADLAIPYAQAFLEAFEKETHVLLGEMLRNNKVFAEGADRLTACAGVSFIKSSFPFHYGYRLAESLCDRAKKDTKYLCKSTSGNLPASCLMFHKVQDSFVSDYDDLIKRELMPQTDISFEFGPYYLSPMDNRWTLDRLMESADKLVGKEGNAVKSNLRNWMMLLHEDPEMALQKLDRLKSIVGNEMGKFVEILTDGSERGGAGKNNAGDIQQSNTVYPVYDVLSLHTINNQKTR